MNLVSALPVAVILFIAFGFVSVVAVLAAQRRRGPVLGSGGVPLGSSCGDLVSKVEVVLAPDGFWLRSSVIAAGMFIGYRYLVASGGKTSQVQFAPGPNGHFVFTGEKPDHVEITHVTAAESGIDSDVIVSDSGSTYSRDLLTAETWRQAQHRHDDSPPPLPSSPVYEPPAPPAY